MAPNIRCSSESRLATRHAGGRESLPRVSDCVPHAHEPVDQLLVTRVVLPLLSSDLLDPVADSLSGPVESPSYWVPPWHLDDYFWRSSGIWCGLNRPYPASDFPGERRPPSIGDASIPSTRSSDCVLLVSRESPKLALRCHHRNGDSCPQSMVRSMLVGTHLTTTFQFAQGSSQGAKSV